MLSKQRKTKLRRRGYTFVSFNRRAVVSTIPKDKKKVFGDYVVENEEQINEKIENTKK
jgi:hypothetical protein